MSVINSIEYELRPYSDTDYEFVYQVKRDAYKIYVEMNFGAWDDAQQREFFDKFISDYGSGAYIITCGGRNIGFYNFSTSWNKYEIGNICIIPPFRGRGIGTMVLTDVLSENADKEICLQYFKQNPVGSLYERLGFERCGETEYHYQMVKNPQK